MKFGITHITHDNDVITLDDDITLQLSKHDNHEQYVIDTLINICSDKYKINVDKSQIRDNILSEFIYNFELNTKLKCTDVIISEDLIYVMTNYNNNLSDIFNVDNNINLHATPHLNYSEIILLSNNNDQEEGIFFLQYDDKCLLDYIDIFNNKIMYLNFDISFLS